jgi:drug/metabolite transporter (DMT)-like permease
MWFFLALGAAVSYGLQYVLLGRHFKEVNVFTYGLVTNAVALVTVGALWLATKAPAPNWTPTQWWSIAAQILCGLAGGLLSYLAIQQKNASLAAFVEICYPLFVVLFAYLFFHEVQLSPRQAVGAALIFAGLLFVGR